jgi:carboxyl-terminal processing protease
MLSKTGEYTRVVRTLPDNPARKAGILAGYIIYKVNDEEVWELDVEAIANKLRGTAGSQVKVTVVRDNAEHEFNITREVFNDVSIDVTYDGSTAIMSVYRFAQDTGTKAQEFAAKFKEKGINKVILDLRDNGGGYVNAARDLASLWIDGELVVTTSGRSVSSTPTYASRGKAYLKDIKTVILTNGSTASASEIVAGALKDYGKATIIGEKTYGKGVVQTMIDMDDGALLKVTTAKWYMPKGSSINGTGIIPDIEVKRSYDDINANRDPQMDKAREI